MEIVVESCPKWLKVLVRVIERNTWTQGVPGEYVKRFYKGTDQLHNPDQEPFYIVEFSPLPCVIEETQAITVPEYEVHLLPIMQKMEAVYAINYIPNERRPRFRPDVVPTFASEAEEDAFWLERSRWTEGEPFLTLEGVYKGKSVVIVFQGKPDETAEPKDTISLESLLI